MTEMRDSYKKRYRMSALGEDGLNIVVSIPRMVILREAEKRELTIEEFLEGLSQNGGRPFKYLSPLVDSSAEVSLLNASVHV